MKKLKSQKSYVDSPFKYLLQSQRAFGILRNVTFLYFKAEMWHAPSNTVIGHEALNDQMRSKAHTAPTTPLVLHRTRIEKYATKKFFINGQ
jgi:hypothetical protein